uniref:NADH-ubiquinone oxidoreductase chain 4 n=1 Tax=Neoperlops gressitti TaxID=2684670 RepID=A0A6B9PPA6_9NEOP|nr:NADH dehydrogenase subunit 4 [Neoperlops gressitti]
MLSLFMGLMFLMPLCWVSQGWWAIQLGLFVMAFMFVILGMPNSAMMGGLSYYLGCDVLSYGLIILSFWICGLMVTASESINRGGTHSGLFLALVVLLMMCLFSTFGALNLFVFYVFFESSLIPTLLLILGWGYQPERMQAGIYLLFYTLLASLPLLMGFFYLGDTWGSLSFHMNMVFEMSNLLLYLALVMAFLVKMPMFLVHLWLPSAHVEAPVSGSMILAGVLLKLGGYGLLRVLRVLVVSGLMYNFLWVGVSLVGGVLVSLICLRQIDLKALIAYSSVAHMGIVLSGLFTMSNWGVCGAYMLMLGHGLCSSGLFCLANICYERTGSRSLMVNRGMMNFMPSMALWWFMLSACNMAAPPSLNLLSEISLLTSVVSWAWNSMIMLGVLSFLSAAYTLYLYACSQHGKMYSGVYSCLTGYTREYLLLAMHWVPLNFLILKTEFFMLWL